MRVFRAVRGRQLLLIFALILVLTLLLARGKEPLQRRLHGVPGGVTYLEQEMAGLFPGEVLERVRAGAGDFHRKPAEAGEDPEYPGGVIPHVLGLCLDTEATAARILAAGRGERVQPVLEWIKPAVTREDFPGRPLYRGNPRKDQAALMINVAWGEEHLPPLLQVLEAERARATFFLVGRWAEKNPDLVKALLEAGHEVASHGYDDRLVLKGLPEEEAFRDIRRSLEVIEAITGEKVRLLTPHRGEFDGAALAAARRLGLTMVLWSLDTADWLKPGVERMLERTVERAFPGAIILMHPTPETAAYLKAALPELRERGLPVVGVGALLDPDPWKPEEASP